MRGEDERRRGYGGGESPDVTECSNAMVCHLAAFASFVLPLGHILGPLFAWLILRKESRYVDQHGREALNFQITMTIFAIVLIVTAVVMLVVHAAGGPPRDGWSLGLIFANALIPAIGLALLGLFTFVCTIVAAIRAYSGDHFRYPLTIRFLR